MHIFAHGEESLRVRWLGRQNLVCSRMCLAGCRGYMHKSKVWLRTLKIGPSGLRSFIWVDTSETTCVPHKTQTCFALSSKLCPAECIANQQIMPHHEDKDATEDQAGFKDVALRNMIVINVLFGVGVDCPQRADEPRDGKGDEDVERVGAKRVGDRHVAETLPGDDER